MVEKNGTKFVSLKELTDSLNQDLPPENAYRIPELAQAWAESREKYYEQEGKKVQEGRHYLTAETGEQLLSEAGCALIDRFAVVDGHTVPILDGARKLFNEPISKGYGKVF